MPRVPETVITSYSIHYTKLYDVLRSFPQCNAHYDSERNVLLGFDAVHLGIATQTADGLKVPVVRHAEARSLA